MRAIIKGTQLHSPSHGPWLAIQPPALIESCPQSDFTGQFTLRSGSLLINITDICLAVKVLHCRVVHVVLVMEVKEGCRAPPSMLHQAHSGWLHASYRTILRLYQDSPQHHRVLGSIDTMSTSTSTTVVLWVSFPTAACSCSTSCKPVISVQAFSHFPRNLYS